MDPWTKLWEFVYGDCGNPCIELTDSMYEVILLYEDGSQATLIWSSENKHWRHAETLDVSPCDVAARDSF